MADHTCFKVIELHLKKPESGLAGAQLPMTICTDPEIRIDDPESRALERNWTNIESLTVDYGHLAHDVETFVCLHGNTPTLTFTCVQTSDSRTPCFGIYLSTKCHFLRPLFSLARSLCGGLVGS
jgi:hypothetical protein